MRNSWGLLRIFNVGLRWQHKKNLMKLRII